MGTEGNWVVRIRYRTGVWPCCHKIIGLFPITIWTFILVVRLKYEENHHLWHPSILLLLHCYGISTRIHIIVNIYNFITGAIQNVYYIFL